jgi:hypothetical protein
LADVFRQTIMGISQNKNPCRLFLFRVFHFKPKSVLKRSRTSRGIEDNTGVAAHRIAKSARGRVLGALICQVADVT